MTAEAAPLHVAVAVIVDRRHRVLVSQRPANVHQGGLWEFPGGKVEHGEGVADALSRELDEELGIVVERSTPLLQVRHDYPERVVLLDVHVVWEFSGQPRGLEGQPVQWLSAPQLDARVFPAANGPIIDAIRSLLPGPAGKTSPGGTQAP